MTSFLSGEALKEILITILPISILILTAEMVFSKGRKNINDVIVTIFGIVYIPLMLIFFSIIRSKFELGKVLIWYIFISAWGSDIFAYLNCLNYCNNIKYHWSNWRLSCIKYKKVLWNKRF